MNTPPEPPPDEQPDVWTEPPADAPPYEDTLTWTVDVIQDDQGRFWRRRAPDSHVWSVIPDPAKYVPAERLAAVTRERDEARADANRLILEHQAFMQALSEALDVPWSSPEMFGTVRHPEEDEIVQWVGEEHAVALRSRRHARAALAGDTPDAPAGRLEDA